LSGDATEESCVTFALDSGETLAIDITLEGYTGETLLRLGKLVTLFNSSKLTETLFNDFSLSCLNSEVGLSEGDLCLSRVSILSDEIASVSSELEIVNLSLSSRAIE
jgi:hypothetical protein